MGRTVLLPLRTGVKPVSTGREATLLGSVGAGGGGDVVGVEAPLTLYTHGSEGAPSKLRPFASVQLSFGRQW